MSDRILRLPSSLMGLTSADDTALSPTDFEKEDGLTVWRVDTVVAVLDSFR